MVRNNKGMGDAGYVALALIGILILSGILIAWVYWPTPGKYIGSGNVITRSFNDTGFTAVEVGGGFRVNVTQGSQYSVKVTTDDNIFDAITVSSSGGVLTIAPKPGVSIVNPTAFRAEVTMPSIAGLDLSGGCVGRLAGFLAMNQSRLSILLSGGSFLDVPQANVASFSISLSGGSRVIGNIYCAGGAMSNFVLSGGSNAELAGACGNVTMDASGASSLSLGMMDAHNVDAVLSGASYARIDIGGTLDADLSGVSTLRYTGNPTMGDINLSGGSTVGPA